jgi:hypothetical protein
MTNDTKKVALAKVCKTKENVNVHRSVLGTINE